MVTGKNNNKISSFKSAKNKTKQKLLTCWKSMMQKNIQLETMYLMTWGRYIAYFCCLLTDTVNSLQSAAAEQVVVFSLLLLLQWKIVLKLQLCSKLVIDMSYNIFLYFHFKNVDNFMVNFKHYRRNSKHFGLSLWELGNSIIVKIWKIIYWALVVGFNVCRTWFRH